MDFPPRISGLPLRTLARLARTRPMLSALERIFRAELKVAVLASLPDAMRGEVPLDVRPLGARPPRTPHDGGHGVPEGGWGPTSAAIDRAYARGSVTPPELVRRALAAARDLAARRPSVGPLLDEAEARAVAEADASLARRRAGKALGPLDGVPFAVKEQMAVIGLPCRVGARHTDVAPCTTDAALVERLRAAGAIVIGTTPMTEYGMTPTGVNPLRPMPRNPHATDRIAGGSSTGSGVAVASGVVPFAIGADGGGSIRIPAALCGVFGIKPTWGRISRRGDTSGGSVSHLGPIASSTLDLARVLEITAGPDPADPETARAPAPAPGSLIRALGRGVKGLRIGVDEGEWRDASPDVARAGETAIRVLAREGAEIVPLTVPMARYAAAIGYVTIAIEARAALRHAWRDHADTMSHDLQLTFAVLETVSALEYVDAQRLRSGLRRAMARAFDVVDLFALPTTVATAARVTDAEFASGFLDARVLDGLCRFTFLGNLTGLPAGSAPVGRDADGLPIGFQLVGDAWDEATVLGAMAHLERVGAARAVRPLVAADLLGA